MIAYDKTVGYSLLFSCFDCTQHQREGGENQ